MSSQSVASLRLLPTWTRTRVALPVLAVGLPLLGLLFADEVAAAVRVWFASTAYNHCFLVIPIALYLAYDRRDRLRSVPLRPWPQAALLALPLAAAWLVAERVGVMEGRQLIAMGFVQALFLGVLGPRLYRVMAAPLLYLFFLVPFGGFLTPALQSFTAHFITRGLDLLGIINYSDGNIIEIPEGTFYVAQACAGLRFLIAAVAFGVLYALVIYRSPGRRITFVAVSLVVPVIANGLRALGIVVLGHYLGSARAAATDHILYGWLFFSIVLLLLILLGLPFRQDARPTAGAKPAPLPPVGLQWPAVAAALVLLVAALGPSAAAVLVRSAGAAPAVHLALGGGCTAAPGGTAAPGLWERHLVCDGHRLTLRVQAFPVRSDPGRIIAAERLISHPLSAEDVASRPVAVAGAAPGTWQVVRSEAPDRTVAMALWVGGEPSGTGLAMRLRQARVSLLGGVATPLLATVAPDATDAAQAGAALQAFFAAEPGLTRQLARVAAVGH